MPRVRAANRGAGRCPVHSTASAGEWPSGKAADSGSANRRFESSLPSQSHSALNVVHWLFKLVLCSRQPCREESDFRQSSREDSTLTKGGFQQWVHEFS